MSPTLWYITKRNMPKWNMDIMGSSEGLAASKKRERFNVQVLERYEFVNYIIEYLKTQIGVVLDPPIYSNHLAFYKATIRDRNRQIPAAIVGYGGSGADLRDLPTPLQTELLPRVFDHWNSISGGNVGVPLLILGHSFDEVFLRKIRLLKVAIPDIRLIQFINVKNRFSAKKTFKRFADHYVNKLANGEKIKNERIDFQSAITEYLKSGGEIGGCTYDVLSIELPCGEGTTKSEGIDILALERKRKWLTVIELKYEKPQNVRLQSMVFQGLDYCNWVEDHKRGLAMLFSKHAIDVRRRTRLILINGPDGFPEAHKEFARACNRQDRYQEIELYLTNDSAPLSFTTFFKASKHT